MTMLYVALRFIAMFWVTLLIQARLVDPFNNHLN